MFNQNEKTAGCKTITQVMEKLHEADGGLNFYETGEKSPVHGMKECLELVESSVKNGEPVKIIGDYDVDGIMSSIILYLAILIRFRVKAEVRLPRRFTEGYGLSMKIIDETEKGLILCVDNGISAVEQIAKAKEKGLKVIIMDHHLKRDDGKLPACDVLIDPHVYEDSKFNDFCGAGLAYRFAEELLGEDNPYLPDLVVMASIGTVADMVSLSKDNRQLVKNGLEAVNQGRGTKGLRHLISVLGLEHVDEETYGFLIGPICNASGRLKDNGAKDVFDYLFIMNKNQDEAKLLNMANELTETNKKRKEMVRDAMNSIGPIMENMDTSVPIVLKTDIPEGIIGIIAGNLAEEYGVPVLVFTRTENDGILKGSGRSGGLCHLKNLLDKCSNLILKYGGHAGAAGMSIKEENLQALKEALEREYKDLGISANAGEKTYDLEISPGQIHNALSELKRFAPFGEENRKPVFYIRGFECTPQNGNHFRVMGAEQEHLKLFGKDVSAVGFGMTERYKNDGCPIKVNILGTLSENYFNGNVYDQIEIIDYDLDVPEIPDVLTQLMELMIF